MTALSKGDISAIVICATVGSVLLVGIVFSLVVGYRRTKDTFYSIMKQPLNALSFFFVGFSETGWKTFTLMPKPNSERMTPVKGKIVSYFANYLILSFFLLDTVPYDSDEDD
jgi:hypothetical protein